MIINKELVNRLRGHPGVTDESVIGVVSSYGKDAQIIEKDDTNDIVVIANTNDIDLDNEVVVASGADTEYFRKNGHIFADHQYDIAQGAAKLRHLDPHPSRDDHKSWRVRARITDNPIGNAIKRIVRETGQIGVSVGFYATDHGVPTEEEHKLYGQAGKELLSIVRAWKWFELSFTLLPCNVACQSLAMTGSKSVEMFNAVDSMITKGLVTRESAALLGMPITPKRKVFAVNDPPFVQKTSTAKTVYLIDGGVMKVG